jgi:hypothetical protein
MMNKKKVAAVVAGGLLVGAVSGGAAWASIPDADGVVHACYLNATGVVTIIDSASTSCNVLQTGITWPTTAVRGVSVSTSTPTSPADSNGTGFIDQSFDCPSGLFAISGNAYYAQNAGINVPMNDDGFHVVSGLPVGVTFQMRAGLTGTYTMQVQLECAHAG